MTFGRVQILWSWFRFGYERCYWGASTYPLHWKVAFYFVQIKKVRG